MPAAAVYGTQAGRGFLEAAAAERVAAHLSVEFSATFSFLFEPTLDATNWRAEEAFRPAVVTRQMAGGGNRKPRGATTQQVLASVLRTAHLRHLGTAPLIVNLLRASTRTVSAAPQSSPQ